MDPKGIPRAQSPDDIPGTLRFMGGAEGAPWQREALPIAEGGAKRRPVRPPDTGPTDPSLRSPVRTPEER